MAGNRMPPLWAIMAMLVLGWNEAMALIWNPVSLRHTLVTAACKQHAKPIWRPCQRAGVPANVPATI